MRRSKSGAAAWHGAGIDGGPPGYLACRGWRLGLVLASLVAGSLAPVVGSVVAQDSWNPFIEPGGLGAQQRRPQRSPNDKATLDPSQPPAPMEGGRGRPGDTPADAPLVAPAVASPEGAGAYLGPRVAVEQTDLPPLDAAGGPEPLPAGAAASARDPQALARLLTEIALPPRSPALAQVLLGLVGPDGPLWGDSTEEIALRSQVLYRAGRIAEADALTRGPAQPQGIIAMLGARHALAAGDRDRACRLAKQALQARGGLPKPVRLEGLAVQGYCGAAQGNVQAASLAAALAREEGGASGETFAALEAVALGEMPQLAAMKRIGVLDWRLAELAGLTDPAALPLDRAEPALLAVLANDNAVAPPARLAAGERAVRANIIDAAALAGIYRRQSFSGAELASAQSARLEPPARRALLLRAAEAERTPVKRTRLVRAALDDARRAGLYMPMAAALDDAVKDVQPVAEIGWFAETAVEVMLAAGRFDRARRWAEVAGQPGMAADGMAGALSHWLALIDIADPAQRARRGDSLASVEDVALRGRFTSEGLHQLASVLDALDYHVPVRLWELASRAPQPTTGHLPPSGVLSDLQIAARGKDPLAAVALVLRALGPEGPEGAHLIALGDSIRALRRAGLEREARAVAFEALFAVWPRASSG